MIKFKKLKYQKIDHSGFVFVIYLLAFALWFIIFSLAGWHIKEWFL